MTSKFHLLVLGLVVMIAGIGGAQDPAAPAPPSADEPEKPRILVLPEAGNRRKDLTREAASLLIQTLMKTGYQVVSLEWAERNDRLLRSGRENGKSARPQICREMYASILVLVGVNAERERKIQGRYRVEDVMHVRMTNIEDSTILLEERSASTRGTSFDSYRKAHHKAVEALCTAVCKKVTARMNQFVEEEMVKGALFTLGLFAEGKDRTYPATFASRLRTLDRVKGETISLVRSDPRIGYFEYRLRYRGRSHGLVEDLFKVADELANTAKEKGQTVDVDFIASTRRVLLFLRTKQIEPESSLDKEVQRQVDALVGNILKDHKESLSSKRLAIEPASIPTSQGPKAKLDAFAREYFRALEGGERKSSAAGAGDETQNALDRGPVFIGGRRFPTLRAARAHLDELVAKYRGSRGGTLAMDIAEMVGVCLKEGELTVLPTESDLTAVLDRIKREAALYREEEAVDPETIALLRTTGAEALVVTRFRPFLESYVLRIAVIDCSSGVEIAHLGRILDKRFKDDLDKVFNK